MELVLDQNPIDLFKFWNHGAAVWRERVDNPDGGACTEAGPDAALDNAEHRPWSGFHQLFPLAYLLDWDRNLLARPE